MASKYSLADDRGVTFWSVYLDAAQCGCGSVVLLRPDHRGPYGACPSCGTDDEAASLCAVEALVGLDHYGERDGDIAVRHGYTTGDGLLGGEYTPALDRGLEAWLTEQAFVAREGAPRAVGR